MDPSGLFFVVNAIKVFHHSLSKPSTCLSNILFPTSAATSEVDYSTSCTGEQTIQIKCLFGLVGNNCFCFLNVWTNITRFVARLHTNQPPLRVYILGQFCSAKYTLKIRWLLICHHWWGREDFEHFFVFGEGSPVFFENLRHTRKFWVIGKCQDNSLIFTFSRTVFLSNALTLSIAFCTTFLL